MKKLLAGIGTLIGATFVSSIALIPGLLYIFFHSIYMSFKSAPLAIFFYSYRFIIGTLHAFGYLFFHIAKFQDILWNVWAGEMFEDFVTTNEHTWYGKGEEITISESTGREAVEYSNKITKKGWLFISALNTIFGQKQHAQDAYELGVKRKELESKYYN